MKRKRARTARVGVAEHGNTAILVTLAADGSLLDRRRIDLTSGLSTHPYHHEGAWAMGRYLDSAWARPTSLDDAVALIQRVHEAAARGAREGLQALAGEVAAAIGTIAIRRCPKLPETILERLADNRAQVVADSVMYRESIAAAARARGWAVCWYDTDRVFEEASACIGHPVQAVLATMGRTAGPPWQAKHKLAAAAALAAGRLSA